MKEQITINPGWTECPVKGCIKPIPRKKRGDTREPISFLCPDHKIFVTPSTFEYRDYKDNLLWRDKEDLALLHSISGVKRESRMGFDNSEDALSWNIFRFLEKEGLLNNFIARLINGAAVDPQLIYWSYSQEENQTLSILCDARKEFELVPEKGSEPDLIVKCGNALIFIEAKLTAVNNTTPTNDKVEQKYVSGGNKWWDEVFVSSFDEIARQKKKYELARFWLLGTWMAQKLGIDFYLVNLVPAEKERNIVQQFSPHIKQDKHRTFLRIAWEDIYSFIANTAGSSAYKDLILCYFENKTIGYDAKGNLKKAFSLD